MNTPKTGHQKIVEFSPSGQSTLMKFLEFLAQQKKWDWSFEVHPEFSLELLEGAAAAKVNPVLAPRILPTLKVSTTQVRAVESLDSFFYDGGAWYPRLLVHEALRRVLVAEARDLDIRSPAFVVGDGESARTVAAVLANMGFSDIFLIGDVMKLMRQKIILSRSQLGINFHILPVEELTMQAVSAGIVVNTDDLSQKKSLLTDLSYFNFMKGNGFALDLNLYPTHNLLLEEAERADLRVLTPLQVAEVVTNLWLERMNIQPMLSKDEIHQTWEAFLKQNPSSV